MRAISIAGVLSALLASQCLAQVSPKTTGTIRGTVFTSGADGEHSLVPHATIHLEGPDTRDTQSDEQGAYLFEPVAPGSYVVTATAPGLTGTVHVELTPGAASLAPLAVSVNAVKSTTTVTASAEPAASEVSAQNVTINTSTVENAPNKNERFEDLLPLVPGVVRGPDGQLNLKGASSTQAGWLVNSANVTDPATGDKAMNLPIDVVSSVQVISNPYDPEYGRFTGAISNVETRTSNFDDFHFSIQNLFPRLRKRGGDIVGLEAVTPRLTLTGPLLKNKIAFTQSFEYRFVRTPVESLPPLQRDTKLESFDSFTQFDFNISSKQTATVSFALFPQKLDYLGLNTFTPQPSTSNLHDRGDQASVQHRYVADSGGLLISEVSYKRVDADVFPNSTAPYELLVETTEGGFFNRQRRRTESAEWQEIYQLSPKQFWGSHEIKVGLDFSHNTYNGRQQFSPVDIVGVAGYALESIQFGRPTTFSINQNEFAWFAGDHWVVAPRLSFDLGLRFDHDSITGAANTGPRAGFTLALTSDRKTLLRAGGGFFYDRVPLNVPAFPFFPDRTVQMLDPAGQVIGSTPYANEITGSLRNPRSEVWNAEMDRQVSESLLVRVAFQQRNTLDNFVLNPITSVDDSILSLSSRGRDSYREFQITGRYQVHHSTINASYVRSRSFGDLNDFTQFFGNDPAAIIQPNQRALLDFDAPNRFLTWAQIAAPWKLTLMPVLDLHTGFPYSVEDELREFVGPRNTERFPRFNSVDLQVYRHIRLPFFKERRAKIGCGIYNLFNHDNVRDVQNDLDSYRFGEFFNPAPRTFRGKFVLEF
ncbi:MAG TPA: TonB-dependent receptor [Bryobacteraceae bacterium]|nr:TonB-dependent receptor [Bryobacteraceae bacterium]